MDGAGNGDSSQKKAPQPEPVQPKTDVLFVHSPVEGGEGFNVIRAREDRIEVGQMSGLKDGEAVTGEIVKLKPRKESTRLFDVDVLAAGEQRPAPARSHAGPARVANEAYRKNWDEIFAAPRKRELLN